VQGSKVRCPEVKEARIRLELRLFCCPYLKLKVVDLLASFALSSTSLR
jgi:hypothetical protein